MEFHHEHPDLPQPEWMRTMPEAPVGCGTFEAAWADCNTERPIGMAVGSIPRSAVIGWCRDHGIVGEYANHVARVVMAVDRGMRKVWKEMDERAAKRKDREHGDPS